MSTVWGLRIEQMNLSHGEDGEEALLLRIFYFLLFDTSLPTENSLSPCQLSLEDGCAIYKSSHVAAREKTCGGTIPMTMLPRETVEEICLRGLSKMEQVENGLRPDGGMSCSAMQEFDRIMDA